MQIGYVFFTKKFFGLRDGVDGHFFSRVVIVFVVTTTISYGMGAPRFSTSPPSSIHVWCYCFCFGVLGRLEVGIQIKDMVFDFRLVWMDATPGLFTYTFLKEVSFALETDRGHPRERVSSVVFLEAHHIEQEICTIFDVFTHEFGVHADEFDWEGISNKLLFNFDCTLDNQQDSFQAGAVLEFVKKNTCKLAVKCFISAE